MMDSVFVKKGDRVSARWMQAKTASLAGVQPKTAAEDVVVTGVVRHVRADHPTPPHSVRLYVETGDGRGELCEKCGVREVEVDPVHLTGHEPA